MSSSTWLFTHDPESHRKVNAVVSTYAERIALEALERAHQKRADQAEQISDLNSPEVRIRAWEKLHGLRLPADPTHPVLEIVATSTKLSLEQVLEEQRARAARNKAAPAAATLNP